MATIRFLLQSKNSPANIYVRFIDGRSIDIKCKTKLLVDFEDWCPEERKHKNPKSDEGKELNKKLKTLSKKILKEYNRSSENIDSEWLNSFINPSAKYKIPQDFISYIDFYISMKKDLTKSMRQKIAQLKKKMIYFQELRKKRILISDTDSLFFIELSNFYEGLHYSKNTIRMHVVVFRQICRHAYIKGVEPHKEFQEIEFKRGKTSFVYLSFEELKLINGIDMSKLDERLSNARDWLIISCYSGQRVSDFMRFNNEMIRIQQGKHLIEFTQVKGSANRETVITLPLHPVILDILEKRNGDFPKKMFEPDYNDAIKDVCRIAEITQPAYGSKIISIPTGNMKENKTGELVEELVWRKKRDHYEKCELITSHIGRRSFATNFYGQIPTPLLMAATGHKKEETFLIYIGKSSYDKAMELANYF